MSKIRPQIFEECPDVEMYLKEDQTRGNMLNVSTITLDERGKYQTVQTEEGDEYFVEDLIVEKVFLEVPGVGYLRPGVSVLLQGDSTEYTLRFGWHTNVSNQTIYSWYLSPKTEVVEESPQDYMSRPPQILSKDRTLYKEMINKIWKAGICNEQIKNEW